MAAGKFIKAEHIEHANRRQRDRVEIRTLLRYGGDEQTAVRPSDDPELCGRRVLLLHEILGDGNEIIEAVLTLFGACAFVPRGAIFAAAADARAHPRAA